MKQKQVRLLWPDVVRIVAIYLVIQIHTTFYSETSPLIMNRIDLMGVPLFVLLSGALLLGKQENYQTFFRKRCLKVLIPWIFWTFLYMAYFYTMHHSRITTEFFSTGTQASQWFHFFFSTFMSSLWFLPMIFAIYVLTPFLRIFVSHAKKVDWIYMVSVWFIVLSLLPFLVQSPLFPSWEPTVIFVPLQFSGYFLLGYVLIKNKLLDRFNLFTLFIFGSVPFLLLLLPFEIFKQFTNGYVFPGIVLGAIFFFYFLYKACTLLEKRVSNRLRNWIALVSGASFGVYIVNEMFIDYFKDDLLRVFSFAHSEVFITTVTFLFVSVIVIGLQRIPGIKYILP